VKPKYLIYLIIFITSFIFGSFVGFKHGQVRPKIVMGYDGDYIRVFGWDKVNHCTAAWLYSTNNNFLYWIRLD
jgi:hypothetical protein